MHILRLCAIAFVIMCSSGCALYHYYSPFYGKVIDRETKQPIEGAVVLAAYFTDLYLSPGGPTAHFLDAREVLTNENGEFFVPSFHAIAFRPLSAFDSHPNVSISKPKYICHPNGHKTRIVFVPNYSLPEDHFVIIELRKKLAEDARFAHDCIPISVPADKMRALIELDNRERSSRGLEPLRRDMP